MSIKIIVSDTDQSHAENCRDIIQAECPTAEIHLIVDEHESVANSVQYALNNGYSIVSRSTSGLTDAMNELTGDTGWAGTEYENGAFDSSFGKEFDISRTKRVGIVHSFGDTNEHTEHSEPSRLDIICAVSSGDGNGNCDGEYGNGLEFFSDEDTSTSWATARVAGVIAQIMVNHPSWNFHDARQALRQTASFYDTGWVADGGYGAIDKTAAKAVSSLDMSSPPRTSITHDSDNKTLTFAWTANKQSGFASTVIARYDSEPDRDDDPDSGHILYQGTATSYEYDYQNAELLGTYYFAFHTYGSYSPIESFDLSSYSLEYESLITQLGKALKTVVDTTPHNNFYNDISGRFYFTEAPADVTYPFSTYFFPSLVPSWTFGNDFEGFLVQFDVYAKERSSININSYSNHLNSLFDWNEDLSLAEYYNIYMQREFVTPPILINDVWQVTTQYRVELQKK